MQTTSNPTAPATVSADVQTHAATLAAAATVAATAKRDAADAKRAARKADAAKPAKPATSKPAKREAVAKPATAAKPAKRDASAEREAAFNATREARKLAADAVRSYYTGASLPFKAAADTFSPTDPKRQPKRPTQRQAALLASMLLAGDNIKRDGTFTRGAFVIDGRNVQPESGCLSDMLNRAVSYVSGPTNGASQRDAVYRVNLPVALAEITALLSPSALRTKALDRLASLGCKPAPAKAKA